MRLDQALQKIGVHVLSVDTPPDQMILHVRVARDPMAVRRWNQTASKLVLASVNGKKSGMWDAEIAKVLYPHGSVVKYTWRVVLSGNLKSAQRIFGEAALEALRTGVEVTEAPLVGNRPPKHDPMTGKLKGGYMVGGAGDSMGPLLIAPHFAPNTGMM